MTSLRAPPHSRRAGILRRVALACCLGTPLVWFPGAGSPEFLQTAWLAAWASVAAAATCVASPVPLQRPIRLVLAGGSIIALAGLASGAFATDTFEWRVALLRLFALLSLTGAFAGEAARDGGRGFLRPAIALSTCFAAGVSVATGLAGRTWFGQWPGLFGNPNWAGAWAAIHLPILLGAWLDPTANSIRWARFLPALAGIATAALLVGSGSRAAWLASGVAGAVFLLLLSRTRGARAAVADALGPVAVALAGGIALAAAGHAFDPRSKLGFDDPAAAGRSLTVRTRIWGATLGMALAHPLLGVGLGQFSAHFPAWRAPEEHRLSGELSAVADPHQTYLARCAEGGLAGAAGLALILAGLAAAARRTPGDPSRSAPGAGAAAALAAAAVAAGFSDLLPHPALLPALAMLGPLALAERAPVPHDPDPAAILPRARWDAAVVLLACGGMLAWSGGVGPTGASAHYARSLAAGTPAEALAACDSALAWAPDWPAALAQRARACDPSGDPARAEQDFTAALARRPRDPALLNDRGVVRARCGRPAQAQADFAAATVIAPALYRAWFNLGNTLALAAKTEEALQAYARAAGAPAGHPDACYNAAALAAANGDEARTRAWLLRGKEIAPAMLERARADPSFAALREKGGLADLLGK